MGLIAVMGRRLGRHASMVVALVTSASQGQGTNRDDITIVVYKFHRLRVRGWACVAGGYKVGVLVVL